MPARRIQAVPPNPSRIRRIERSFAWLDHRLLRDGHLERMTLIDLGVYVFLVLAADRNGVSFYRKDVVSKKLGIEWSQFECAKARLLDRGLIAFKPFHSGEVEGFYQVLPLHL